MAAIEEIADGTRNSPTAVHRLPAKEDEFNGIVVNIDDQFPKDVSYFVASLRLSLELWTSQKKKGIWLKLPADYCDFVPPAIKPPFKFKYHHVEDTYVMLVLWLGDEPSTLPANASHTIGVGAFVLDDQGMILAVQERFGLFQDKWKMPSGVIHQGENIFEGAIREVKKETGVDREFVEVIGFRQSHGGAFGIMESGIGLCAEATCKRNWKSNWTNEERGFLLEMKIQALTQKSAGMRSWAYYVSEHTGRAVKSCEQQYNRLEELYDRIYDHESRFLSGTASSCVSFWMMDEAQLRAANEERPEEKKLPKPNEFPYEWFVSMQKIKNIRLTDFDDLIEKIAPSIKRMIDDALMPYQPAISALFASQRREEAEWKHQEEMLAIEEQNLALDREEMAKLRERYLAVEEREKLVAESETASINSWVSAGFTNPQDNDIVNL